MSVVLYRQLRFLWLGLLVCLFLLLRIRLLGQRGGVSFGSRGGGVSLVLCEGSSVVCGGIIHGSDGKRFCCKLANECQVESHKALEVLYQDGALYIRAARMDQARAKLRSYWSIKFREILLWRNSSGFIRRLMFGLRTSILCRNNTSSR
jgi:hypothetical protein